MANGNDGHDESGDSSSNGGTNMTTGALPSEPPPQQPATGGGVAPLLPPPSTVIRNEKVDKNGVVSKTVATNDIVSGSLALPSTVVVVADVASSKKPAAAASPPTAIATAAGNMPDAFAQKSPLQAAKKVLGVPPAAVFAATPGILVAPVSPPAPKTNNKPEPPATTVVAATGISAPASQHKMNKQEHQQNSSSSQLMATSTKIKSPKTPGNNKSKSKNNNNDASLSNLLHTSRTGIDLGDSSSMLSTKTDGGNNNAKTKQRSKSTGPKHSEGSLLSTTTTATTTPKSPPKAKVTKAVVAAATSTNNSPVRPPGTTTAKPTTKVHKIKKSTSESNVATAVGVKSSGNGTTSDNNELLAGLADKLREANLSLPTVVAIGDTGVGKTSLLSALCRVPLPNHDPTRCPISIRLPPHRDAATAADPSRREARVWVEWKSHGGGAHRYPEFPPVTISDWKELPGTIRAAQEFILELCQKPLTNDTIVLQVIQGAGGGMDNLVDFTAVDLPGTVPNNNDEDDDDEELRSDMAQLHHEYLRQAIILAVHDAATDWQNSPVIADALAVDPEGLRTMHCLVVKSDLLTDDFNVQRLHKSEYREIRHIHIVKNSSSDNNSSDAGGDDSVEDEQQFFGTERWRPMDKKGLLGVTALRGRLGSLQIGMVRDSLPAIMRKTKEKREAVLQQIGEIGVAFVNDNDRRSYYKGVCKAVVAKVASSLSGKGGDYKGRSVASRLHEDCSHFRDRIMEGTLATVQTVREGSFVLVSGRSDVVRGEVVHIDMEKGFACVDFVDEDGKRNKTLFDQVDMKAPEDIDENDVWAAGNRIFIGRANNKYDALRKIPLTAIRTDPSWLKPKMADEVNEDLPCFLNFDTFRRIVIDNIEDDWRPHVMRLLDLVRTATHDAIGEAIHAHDDKRHKNLIAMLTKKSETVLQELLSAAHRQIQSHLEEEKHPFTQDLEFYSELANRRQNALKQRLMAALRFDESDLNDFSVVRGIVEDVFTKHSHRPGGEMLADDMESILSSYGSFAARRVLDRTPQICWQLLRQTPTALSTAFDQATDNALRECLSTDPSEATKQKELTDALHRLDRMLELYRELS